MVKIKNALNSDELMHFYEKNVWQSKDKRGGTLGVVGGSGKIIILSIPN